MSQTVYRFRIFLSSPGDVAQERAIARTIIDNLRVDRELKGKISLELIAWDIPGAPPMEANLPPQQAVNRGLPMPAECDIVVAVMWSRMGTPVTINGVNYLSGTHYEFENAMKSARAKGVPRVLIYRRTEEPNLRVTDPEFPGKYEQWKTVQKFFEQFKDQDTGELRGGVNHYGTPDDFSKLLESHLKTLLLNMLKAGNGRANVLPDKSTPDNTWPAGKSPFPGLRAFTTADAPVFYGRGRETDELFRRVTAPDTRFVVVIGASGSGKSSLVGAGLIPRLKAIFGDHWRVVRMTPDQYASGNPFISLAAALDHEFSDIRDQQLTINLHSNVEYLARLLKSMKENVLLFIDQFEELFTTVQEEYRDAFVTQFMHLAGIENVRVIVTLREDFYGKCLDYPILRDFIKTSSYPLGPSEESALFDMIEKPAVYAGITIEPDLIETIVKDTGKTSGTLPFMAFTLDALHKLAKQRSTNTKAIVITSADYEELGGVKGTISNQAEKIYNQLKAMIPFPDQTFDEVFRELIDIDDSDQPIRKRVNRKIFKPGDADILIEKFVGAGLLIGTMEGTDNTITIVHDALLDSWERLITYIERQKENLIRFKRLEREARFWSSHNRDPKYLWDMDELRDLEQLIERMSNESTDSANIRDFVYPPSDYLKDMFNLSYESPMLQVRIVERLRYKEDVETTVSLYLSYIEKNEPNNEVMKAFFGSFTAYPYQFQPIFLDFASPEHTAEERCLAIRGLLQIALQTNNSWNGKPILSNKLLVDTEARVRSIGVEAMGRLAELASFDLLVTRLHMLHEGLDLKPKIATALMEIVKKHRKYLSHTQIEWLTDIIDHIYLNRHVDYDLHRCLCELLGSIKTERAYLIAAREENKSPLYRD